MTAKAIGLRLDPNVYACIIYVEDIKDRRVHFPFLYFHPPPPRNPSARSACALKPDPRTTAPFAVRGLRFRVTFPHDGAGRARLVFTPSLAPAAAPAPRSRAAA